MTTDDPNATDTGTPTEEPSAGPSLGDGLFDEDTPSVAQTAPVGQSDDAAPEAPETPTTQQQDSESEENQRLRWADYTKKRQADAQARREWEAEREQQRAELQQQRDQLQTMMLQAQQAGQQPANPADDPFHGLDAEAAEGLRRVQQVQQAQMAPLQEQIQTLQQSLTQQAEQNQRLQQQWQQQYVQGIRRDLDQAKVKYGDAVVETYQQGILSHLNQVNPQTQALYTIDEASSLYHAALQQQQAQAAPAAPAVPAQPTARQQAHRQVAPVSQAQAAPQAIQNGDITREEALREMDSLFT